MRIFALALGVAVLSTAPALSADLRTVRKAPVAAPAPTSPWDIAFGASIATDYNFRGISQSDRGPSVNAYFEPRYNVMPNLQLYAGVSGYSTKLPTDPTGEFDLYGGFRPTFDKLALDFGVIYYAYPKERQIDGTIIAVPNGATSLTDTDFLEFLGKGTYTFNENFSAGLGVYYTADWLNTGADGTYLTGNAKLILPSTFLPTGVGMFVSGELAHYWLGDTKIDPIAYPVSLDLPDYTYWNIGLAFTYKVFTLDLRYHDTDLSKEECYLLTGDPGASIGSPVNRSKWCGSAFIAKLGFDMTLDSLK